MTGEIGERRSFDFPPLFLFLHRHARRQGCGAPASVRACAINGGVNLKRKWYTRVLAALLALLICIAYPARAYALAAEGAIIGGAAAGISLTFPQVAIVLLAVMGGAYLAEEAIDLGYDIGEELGESLIIDIRNSPHYNPDDWNMWNKDAENGIIELIGAPVWIYETIKKWGEGFLLGGSSIYVPGVDANGYPIYGVGDVIPAGQPTPDFSPNRIFKFNNDVTKVGFYSRIVDAEGLAFTAVYTHYIAPVSDVTLGGVYFYDVTPSVEHRASVFSQFGYDVVQTYHAYSYVLDSEDDLEVMDFASGYLDNTGNLYSVEEIYSMVTSGEFGSSSAVPLYPDATFGGVASEIQSGTSMDDINLPDLIVPGAEVFPINPSEGQTEGDAVTDYISNGLVSGTLTWEEYMDAVAQNRPTVTVPNPDTGVNDTFELTDEGRAESPVPSVPPVSGGDYTLDLTDFFPFCIPFDIYEFLSILAAEPEAPVFEWSIPVPQMGETYSISVDLSAWDGVAQLFRNLELLAFIVGLALITRDKILRG